MCGLDIILKFVLMYFSSISQDTLMRYFCCVYYRIECMTVVKFRATYSRRQGSTIVYFLHINLH